MEIGIDSFAAAFDENSRAVNPAERLRQLIEQIVHADEVGLDSFGVGEHHRREFLDSAPAIILGAAAVRTQRIRLTSAVTVLSAEDPVRAFQNFATIDLLSRGRAEMIVGRGSSIEAFPLFGFRLEDYDALFAEKLELLLNVRAHEHVQWSGRFRPALTRQGVYPRPVQNPLPIWLGVGGTPQSFSRAGELGLPLMVAIIGGEPRRFRPLIDLYRDTYARHRHPEGHDQSELRQNAPSLCSSRVAHLHLGCLANSRPTGISRPSLRRPQHNAKRLRREVSAVRAIAMACGGGELRRSHIRPPCVALRLGA